MLDLISLILGYNSILRTSKKEKRTKILKNIQNIFLLILATFIVSCSKDEATDMRSSSEVIYERAKYAMDNGNFRNAVNYLEVLTTSFPFSNEAKQAQLDLIYTHYRSSSFEEAIDEAKQFEKENPTHPRVDYALYMRGISLFEGQHQWYHEIFDVDLTERPPSKTEEAFSVFSQLLRRYPESIYIDDARQRMIFLRNRLASYENHVAQHYLERGAYIAAINRAKYALEQYSGAPATIESLEIIANAYNSLGMDDLAEQAESIFLANQTKDLNQTIVLEESEPWYKFW